MTGRARLANSGPRETLQVERCAPRLPVASLDEALAAVFESSNFRLAVREFSRRWYA